MIDDAVNQLNNRLMDGLVFCRKAYAIFNKIQHEQNGVSQLRLRNSETTKRLIEEIFPIARYIQYQYTEGRIIRIKWINGNQNHDAIIFQKGRLVEIYNSPKTCYLEVTTATHPQEYLARIHINAGNPVFGTSGLKRDKKTKEIISHPVRRRNLDFVNDFAEIIIQCINKKSQKNYPLNTILLIACELSTLYTRDEWMMLIQSVESRVIKHQFIEIFLYDPVCKHHTMSVKQT